MTETSQATRYKQLLRLYLPATAVEGVYDYLNHHGVHLHITRERHTKLGDYRWPQRGLACHKISVNGNLGPYMFLLVLLHEMAHLDTRLQYEGRVSPHGHEWQRNYALRLKEYRDSFPPESRELLDRYAQTIPLVRRTGEAFEQVLKRYNPDYTPEQETTLDDLPAGSCFVLVGQPKLHYRSLEHRRTRWLCQCLDDGRQYLIRGAAPVMPSQS